MIFELKAVGLKAVELAASALERWTQGQAVMPEGEIVGIAGIVGEEAQQRWKVSDREHGSVLLQGDRRAVQIAQRALHPHEGRARWPKTCP